jgi:hypothetical protein
LKPFNLLWSETIQCARLLHDQHLCWTPRLSSSFFILTSGDQYGNRYHLSISFWWSKHTIVIYLACHRRTSTKSASDLHLLSTNMTIVINDPTLWQYVDQDVFHSYFVGSWRAVSYWCCQCQSNPDWGFTVASFVIVTYDLGEHDNAKGLLISYKYVQHLRLDKRYVDAMTGAAILLRMVV